MTNRVAGDMITVQLDAYLREQDLEGLRVEDCLISQGEVALLLGRGHRGESTKSGREQGVVLDYPLACDIIRQYCSGKAPNAKVFPISIARYRVFWKEASLAVLGSAEAAGPPHTLRHSGASRDLSTNYRTFEQVKRRGRWKADDSVQRYARPHAWVRACISQPEEVRVRGKAILEGRLPRAAVPAG